MHSQNNENIDSGVFDSTTSLLDLSTTHSEKDEMIDLNDRFANYIKYIKNNENQNIILKSLEEVSQVPEIQLKNLKKTYETEIKDLRNALDKQSNEMAKMSVDNDKLNAEISNLNNEIKNKDNYVIELLKDLENEKIKLSQYQNRVRTLEKSVIENCDKLEKCQKQLEKETLLRTASDNACLTLKEKMEFNDAVFKKELGALLLTNCNTIKTLEEYQANAIDDKLKSQMIAARTDLNDILNQMKEILDKEILGKIDNAFDNINKKLKSSHNNKKQNNVLMKEKFELKKDFEVLKASHIKLEDQLSDLNTRYNEEIERLKNLQRNLSNEKLEDLENLLNRLSNLTEPLGCKNLLDTEISIYQRLLESEERRTNQNFNGSEPICKKRKVGKEHSITTGRKIIKPNRKSCAIM